MLTSSSESSSSSSSESSSSELSSTGGGVGSLTGAFLDFYSNQRSLHCLQKLQRTLSFLLSLTGAAATASSFLAALALPSFFA